MLGRIDNSRQHQHRSRLQCRTSIQLVGRFHLSLGLGVRIDSLDLLMLDEYGSEKS